MVHGFFKWILNHKTSIPQNLNKQEIFPSVQYICHQRFHHAVAHVCHLRPAEKMHSSSEQGAESFSSSSITLVQSFLTEGGLASPGGVNKFPGGVESLRALQHGNFLNVFQN